MRGKLTLLDEINICLLYIQLNENTDKYTTRLSWSINAPCVLCHYEAEKRPARFCFIQMMRATEKFPLFQIDLKLMGRKEAPQLNLFKSLDTFKVSNMLFLFSLWFRGWMREDFIVLWRELELRWNWYCCSYGCRSYTWLNVGQKILKALVREMVMSIFIKWCGPCHYSMKTNQS